MQTKSTNVRLLLKAATQSLHEILDSHSLLAPLATKKLQRDDYELALRVLAGWLIPTEKSLAGWESNVPELMLPERRKAHLIEHDLRELGVSKDRLQLCPQVPRISSPEEVYGILYVTEGATLGGSVLSRSIEAALGSTVSIRYFQSYGSQTGYFWQSFLERLEEAPSRGLSIAQMASAAQASFRSLCDWLNEYEYSDEIPDLIR